MQTSSFHDDFEVRTLGTPRADAVGDEQEWTALRAAVQTSARCCLWLRRSQRSVWSGHRIFVTITIITVIITHNPWFLLRKWSSCSTILACSALPCGALKQNHGIHENVKIFQTNTKFTHLSDPYLTSSGETCCWLGILKDPCRKNTGSPEALPMLALATTLGLSPDWRPKI